MFLVCFLRVLVTGGAGFIGSNVVGRLFNGGFEVYVVDDLSHGSVECLKSYLDSGLKFFKFDVSSPYFVSSFSRFRFDVIIHLAALISVEESNLLPSRYHEVNVGGTLNVLELARRVGAEKFIFASSAAVYGDPVTLPISELHPLNPKSIYAASKVEGELLVGVYRRLYGVKTVSLRLFNVYGPGQRFSNYSGVIRIFIENALRGLPLTIYGDGMQTRDFIYIDDVVKAIMLFVENRDFNFDVYNVGSGFPTRIIDLASMIIKLVNRSVNLNFVSERPGDVKFSYADTSRIRGEFNFNCSIDLREGLTRTISYVSQCMRGSL